MKKKLFLISFILNFTIINASQLAEEFFSSTASPAGTQDDRWMMQRFPSDSVETLMLQPSKPQHKLPGDKSPDSCDSSYCMPQDNLANSRYPNPQIHITITSTSQPATSPLLPPKFTIPEHRLQKAAEKKKKEKTEDLKLNREEGGE
jgi:hypothetical protein